MRDAWVKVLAFHKAMEMFDQIGDFAAPAFAHEEFRLSFIREELEELESAVMERDMPRAADALADIVYVAIGAASAWGVYLPDIFDEVHRTNMLKKDGPRRADGKKLKPPGWKPPDVAGVLERQVKMEKSLRRFHELREEHEE